jgi:hypothetical protein
VISNIKSPLLKATQYPFLYPPSPAFPRPMQPQPKAFQKTKSKKQLKTNSPIFYCATNFFTQTKKQSRADFENLLQQRIENHNLKGSTFHFFGLIFQ